MSQEIPTVTILLDFFQVKIDLFLTDIFIATIVFRNIRIQLYHTNTDTKKFPTRWSGNRRDSNIKRYEAVGVDTRPLVPGSSQVWLDRPPLKIGALQEKIYKGKVEMFTTI